MSESTQPNQSIKYPIVPMDAMVDIQISGNFLNKMQHLYIALVTEIGHEELLHVIKRFQDGTPSQTTSEEAFIIFQLLIKMIEEAAAAQNKTKDVDVTPQQFSELIDNIAKNSKFA